MNKRILFFLLAALSLSVLAQQQPTNDKDKDKKEATQPATTLRTNVHLVVLDVVALDDHGHPDANLNRDDFVVLEDGKPQEIKQFERSMASTGPVEVSKPLAPNEYRNVPAEVPNAVNVVLLDMLNTPVRDQGEARKHLVSFLRGMPKGRQVALYGLDTRLHLIQDFTGNSDTLIAAAEKAESRPSALQQTTTDKNADGEFVDDLKHNAFTPDVAERVQNFMKNTDTVK